MACVGSSPPEGYRSMASALVTASVRGATNDIGAAAVDVHN